MVLKLSMVVPDWVRWVATDEDGDTGGYSHEPVIYDTWWTSEGKTEFLCDAGPQEDFKKELYKVVEGELVRVEK